MAPPNTLVFVVGDPEEALSRCRKVSAPPSAFPVAEMRGMINFLPVNCTHRELYTPGATLINEHTLKFPGSAKKRVRKITVSDT